MQIFKIRNKAGLFSTGGMSPRFSKKGKNWAGRGPLSAHLNLLSKSSVYRDCEIVTYELAETVAVSAEVLMQESLMRKAEREAKEKARIQAWREEQDRKHYERLKKQFG